MKKETEMKLFKLHNLTLGIYAFLWISFLVVGIYLIRMYVPMYFNLVSIIVFIIFWFFVATYLDRIEIKAQIKNQSQQPQERAIDSGKSCEVEKKNSLQRELGRDTSGVMDEHLPVSSPVDTLNEKGEKQ